MAGRDADLAHRITDSVVVTALSRLAMLAMPILFSAVVWLAWDYVDSRFAAATATTATLGARQDRMEDAVAIVVNRVVAIETGAARGRQARDADFAQLLDELQSLKLKVDAGATAIAGLSAKVEILLQRADAGSFVIPSVPRELTRN